MDTTLLMYSSFRPLDGESISKPIFKSSGMSYSTSFRPLDGESISKLEAIKRAVISNDEIGFRPLDGESISKPTGMGRASMLPDSVSVP